MSLPKTIKDVKSANDACYLIAKLVDEMLATQLSSEQIQACFNIRNVAYKGLEQENKRLKTQIAQIAQIRSVQS